MIWRFILQAWHHHHGFCLILGSAAVLALAWLRVRWEYYRLGRREAPARWYTGCVPSEFLLPNRWSLAALNRDYRPSPEMPEKAEEARPPTAPRLL